MFRHFSEYRLGIREMQADDIIEIDTLEELKALDHSYDNLLDTELSTADRTEDRK